MSRPAIAGIFFIVAIVAILAYMSYNLAHRGVRAHVCMEFNGRVSCKTVSGDDRRDVLQTAAANACADIAGGVTDTIACEHSTPKSVEWK